MEKTRITNLNIIEKPSVDGYFYYQIFDNNEVNGSDRKVFFAFRNKVKENWDVLESSHNMLGEIEIEWERDEKGNKVANITDYTITI